VLGAASTPRSTPLRRAALAIALWATTAAASEATLPDGFGALRFGSSLAQATAAIPSLQPMTAVTSGAATPAAAAMPVAYYRAENQAFEGLRPCTALLGFVTDRFYEVRLDCGHDAKVGAHVRERFGTPAQEDEQFLVWQNASTSVSLNRTTMGVSLADRPLTQAVHQMIIQKALGGAVPAPAAPPATPAH
jgi:hypothetical protein